MEGCSVEEIEEEEEGGIWEDAPYFGHVPTGVGEGYFQVGSINIHNLKHYKGSPDDEQIFKAMKQMELNLVAMQETGVNWSVVSREDQWRARMNEHLDPSQVCASMQHNRHYATNSALLWGGTGVMTHGKLKHFAMGAGSDNVKLGRWTWARYPAGERAAPSGGGTVARQA